MEETYLGYTALLMLAGAPLVALYAGLAAFRKASLFWEDAGTLILPPIGFIMIGATRPELHFGFALVFWPIIIAAISCYAFAIKVMAIDPRSSSVRFHSSVLAVICSGAAAIMALSVGPWYE